MNYIQRRNGIYYFRRSIPAGLRYKFGKREFIISLKTRDRTIAALKYAEENRKAEAKLQIACQSSFVETPDSFRKLASDAGIQLLPSDLETVPVGNLIEVIGKNLDAVLSLPDDWAVRTKAFTAGLSPGLKLSELYQQYKEITRDDDLKRTEREKQKAHKPIERAISEFVETMGDQDVLKLTKKDAYKFREKLIADIAKGSIEASTAKKKIMHLRKIVSVVFQRDYPEKENPFEIKSIKENKKGHRKAFTEIEIEVITEKLKLSGVNDQLKAIIFVAMFTGAGCKELALLAPSDIILDASVPHILIDSNEFRQQVKNGGERHRKVPLYGEALEWMRRFPDGFPRYRRDNGGEAVSVTARKFIRQYADKTFYCFRHRMADLLRNSGCEDRLANAILGHKQGEMGAHYGNGYDVKVKLNALAKAHEEGRIFLKGVQNEKL